MELASYTDYKKAIRGRAKELRKLRPDFTLRKLASKIPIQHTYLSRVLNDPRAHLNEEDLFQAAQVLEFFPDQTDYLLLLRSHDTAVLPARRDYLFRKIEKARKRLGVRADVRDVDPSSLTQEMSFLFDPLCVLVLVSLHVPAIRRDPRQLCAALGVPLARLKEILRKLELADFVVLGVGGTTVTEIRKARLHYPREHPLMRVHQYLQKTMLQDRLLKTPEEGKESFLATFTADRAALEEIRGEYRKFVARVEQVASSTKEQGHLYQMAFDLCLWL